MIRRLVCAVFGHMIPHGASPFLAKRKWVCRCRRCGCLVEWKDRRGYIRVYGEEVSGR